MLPAMCAMPPCMNIEMSRVDGKRRRLKTRNQNLLSSAWNLLHTIRGPDVAPADDLSRHCRKCISESFVSAQLLEEDKDEDIDRDESVVNDRRGCAIAIVVVKREDHLAPLMF